MLRKRVKSSQNGAIKGDLRHKAPSQAGVQLGMASGLTSRVELGRDTTYWSNFGYESVLEVAARAQAAQIVLVSIFQPEIG